MMKTSGFKMALIAGASFAAIMCSAGAMAEEGAVKSFDIPQGDLKAALTAYIRQSGKELIFRDDQIRGLTTEGVQGMLSTSDALSRLLEGSQLKVKENPSGPLLIIADKSGAMDAGTSGADDSQENTFVLEEIIVTATRRAESLQDVPIAISALTPQLIERQGIENFADYARQVPGLNLNQGSKNEASLFTIRGIGTGVTGSSLQKTVSVYIDEVPVSNLGIVEPDLRLYDVERVEVLRGPQGTLFGSGSLAGAVRVITKKADTSGFDASALVDLGLTGSDSFRQRYNGMVNLPIVEDKLAARVVGYLRNEEGYVDDVSRNIDNIDTIKDWGVRTSVRWQPTERFNATFGMIYEESEPQDLSLFNPALGKHKASWFISNRASSELALYNATLEYDLDWATLSSSTNYADTSELNLLDISGVVGSAFGLGLRLPQEGQTIVQELRLVSTTDSKVEWVLGGFFLKRNEDTVSELFTTDEFLESAGISGLPDATTNSTHSTTEVREIAAYGELSYHLTDTLTLLGGLRYAEFEVSSTVHGDRGFGSNFFALAFGGGGNATLTDVAESVTATGKLHKLTKKISLTWQPNEDQTYYALVSEGFRIGQPNALVNGGVSLRDPNDLVIPPLGSSDTLWNYEIGAKTYWLDKRLKVNLALYYIDWSDIQLQARRPSDAVLFVTNAGQAVSKGVELEALATPNKAWEFGLNLTIQEAKITSLSAEEALITGAVDGGRLLTPDFQIAGHVQYTWDLDDGTEIYARADAQHVGSYPNLFPNVSGRGTPNGDLAYTDAYQNVNASVGWVGDKITVAAYVENLLNNDDYVYVLNASTLPNKFGTLRPRTFGIRASWKY